MASVFATVGLKDEETEEYQKNLTEGKYLLVAQGNKEEVARAMGVLNSHGQHTYAAVHKSDL